MTHWKNDQRNAKIKVDLYIFLKKAKQISPLSFFLKLLNS